MEVLSTIHPASQPSAAWAPQNYGVVPGLLWAFVVRADGSARPLALDEPIEGPADGWVWLHINLADTRAHEWLRSAELLAPALAMLLSRDRHQQLHATERCIYGIFADFTKRIEGPGDELGHFRFVMMEHVLISSRHHPLCAPEYTRQALAHSRIRLPTVASLLELIVEHLADGMDEIAAQYNEDLNQIETTIATGGHQSERSNLTRVRLGSARLHRRLSGLRPLFHRLERYNGDEFAPSLRIATGKVAQRLDAIDHTITELRHRAQLLQDEIAASTAEATNRNLQVLAVLSALFLPPTLVSGIFGMNTKGLPFSELEDAFLWASAIMIVSIVLVFVVMRHFGIVKLKS